MAFGEQFLTDPATLPLSFHGESWGNECLIVDFVGGPYHIIGLSREQAAQLRNHYAGSCSDDESGQDSCVTIQVIKTSSSVFKDIQELPWDRTFDLDHHADYLNIAGLHVIARLCLRPNNNALIWTDRSSHLDFCINIFENIFRIIVTYRLHQNGGMLIHSACVVDDEGAILFPGRSNDGKSTLSKISLQSGRTVLSDDMNALTWVDGKPVVEKVPFSGDLGRTWTRSNQYPVKGIFGICKSSESRVTSMPLSQTVALLVASAPYLNTDLQRMPDLLADLHRFAQTVPHGKLGFEKDQDCWPKIRHYLSQQEKK